MKHCLVFDILHIDITAIFTNITYQSQIYCFNVECNDDTWTVLAVAEA